MIIKLWNKFIQIWFEQISTRIFYRPIIANNFFLSKLVSSIKTNTVLPYIEFRFLVKSHIFFIFVIVFGNKFQFSLFMFENIWKYDEFFKISDNENET